MQCAARSAPQSRSRPRARASIELGADAVGRGGEQRSLVERVEPGEGPEAGRAGRLDRGAQPLDDGVGDRERDAGRRVASAGIAHGRSSVRARGSALGRRRGRARGAGQRRPRAAARRRLEAQLARVARDARRVARR